MSKFDPSAHIPVTNMLAYVGSTPKAPLDPGTAAFVHPPAAIIQPADMSAEQFKAEARTMIKSLDTRLPRMLELAEAFKKRWREFGPTRDLACNEIFGCALSALRSKLNYWQGKLESAGQYYLTTEEDKKNTLTQIADLPDPLDFERPAVHAGPAPKPAAAPKPKASEPLENGETVADYKRPRATPTDNGKPVYALPVWKDLLDFYGHALNRLSDANRAIPDPKLYQTMEAETKDLMNKSRMWREKGRK